MRRPTLVLVLLTSLLAAGAPAAADEAARDAEIVAHAVDGYIRPAVARFAADAHRLEQSVTTYCATPGAATRKPADAAFRAAVEGWSGVQFLRFGPLTEAHRLERVAYWPDPKGIGLRQIRTVLAERDPSVTDPATLAGKSVALQGLTALEYLLYGDDGDPAGAPGEAGAFRCAYAVAAARSLAGLTAAVAREWAGPDGFAGRLLAPGGDDPLYRTSSEALAELHRALGTGLQVTQDLKLKPVLGRTMDAARPFAAPFRRSGLSVTVLAADLKGLRAYFVRSGFARSVADEYRWLGDSMAFELDNAVRAAEAVTMPVDEAVYDDAARGRLGYLLVVLGHLRDLTQQDLAAALGLKVGFNALDGD